jgi:DNA gyrase subunit B
MATKSNSKTKLSAEQLASIESYKDSITQLENDIVAIRRVPGMYVGALGAAGLRTMIREIFQNSVDQLIMVDSPCDFITVLFDERDYHAKITDNGLGLPHELMVKMLTENHVSKNFENKRKGEYPSGMHGVGAKVVNALSERFDVKSYKYNGTCRHMVFSKGELQLDKMISNKEFRQGTEIEFWPDHTRMGDTPLDPAEVYLLVQDILSLLPIGSRVDYTSINKKGKIYHELMVNEHGILSNIYNKSSAMIIPPIFITRDTGDMRLDCAFTFDQERGEDITGYVNRSPSSFDPKNVHIVGTIDGISTWFCNYINKIFLTDREKGKIKVSSIDIRDSLKLMVSAYHIEPEFTGQAKEVFSNEDFRPFAKAVILEGLDEWAKARPQELLKACKFLRDIAVARIKADNEIIKVRAKYETSASTGLPQKYLPPTNRKDRVNTELFIVEGDSALGTARNARDEKYQGIFPIRGKILNVFQATPAKIAANTEIASIIQILGAGYGKNFDIDKVRVGKIIFMSDGDNDGSHIADLLLLLFLKMFPGLIESGRVYKAMPPLYAIPLKNRMEYFAERTDLIRYTQKEYYKKNTVANMDGKPIDAATFSRILIDNADYIYDFNTIAERYKINPILLEMILVSYIKNEKQDKLIKSIVSEFRFMTKDNFHKEGSTLKIKGLIDGRVETIFYNERFIKECEPLIEPLRKAIIENHTLFMVNGVKTCLYNMVYNTMNSIGSVIRYKGLGEMNSDQLKKSTMSPESRTLIQYTINDIDETMKIIRQYDSNKKLILQKIGTVSRDDLIGI